MSRCASAALTQAQAQYGAGYGNRYGQQNAYAYNRGVSNMRVTAITDVQRRSNGLRVSGTMSSGVGAYGNRAYGGQYGYQGQAYQQPYAATALSFRCNVDYNGSVTGVRIRAADAYRG